MGFNYLFVNHVVPSIAKNIKARRKTGIIEESSESSKELNINITLPDVITSKSESEIKDIIN